MTTESIDEEYDRDDFVVPKCPVCATNEVNWEPMSLFQIGALARVGPHLLNAWVAVCPRCKFSVPLDYVADSAPPRKACNDYQGICKRCQRPQGEHKL